MKNLIKITSLILLLVGLNGISFGQDYFKVERNSPITFDNESDTVVFKIDCTDEYNFLSVQIESQLNQGQLMIELIDPKSNLIGNYTIITMSPSEHGKMVDYKEKVQGKLEKSIREPFIGSWLVRIIPVGALGKTTINYTLAQNPRAHLLELNQVIQDIDAHMK